MSTDITVRVLKYDGTEYRRWNARLATKEGALIVLDAEFEEEVSHESLGTIPRGTRTVEYYWLDRWYNIFQFMKDDGATRLFYCNINTPPSLQNDVLSYVDLDIDILVDADLSYRVLDLDEFAANAQRYCYSDETKQQAQKACTRLKEMIEVCQFPFAGK